MSPRYLRASQSTKWSCFQIQVEKLRVFRWRSGERNLNRFVQVSSNRHFQMPTRSPQPGGRSIHLSRSLPHPAADFRANSRLCSVSRALTTSALQKHKVLTSSGEQRCLFWYRSDSKSKHSASITNTDANTNTNLNFWRLQVFVVFFFNPGM